MKNKILKNYKHTAFLIGDSKIDGKDQIFSESMGFAPASPYSFAELNARKLRESRAFVEQNRYTNIRIVHQWWDGICNEMGVISEKKRREKTMPFDFNNIDIKY